MRHVFIVSFLPGPLRSCDRAAVAQLVERVLGKDEVTGPSPVSSSLVHTLFRFSV